MNKNHHRLVFNAARGCIMAVAETVSGCCKGAGAAVAKSAAGAVQAAAALTVGLGVLPSALVQAQIVADPGAPAGQRPTVLTTPNGAPLVNIQTPSAAGVSRNTYQQFDVNAQGAVLNNSRQNTQTQLGGWVQGNPWLARGEARVILNEVNSTNPSQLKGFVEVAGQRAEVIIANPAGIHVDGAGFINASRATLTTGVPQFNNGSLEAFRVQRGTIRIDGAGLDAGHTDYTGILARAIEVNARVHAKDLTLITGDNTVAIDQSQVLASSTPDGGEAPVLALDVSQLGGMYAGKITFIGTEAGVGVRHHGTLSASAGDVSISSGGWLSSAGVIESQRGSVSAQTAQAQHLSGSVTAAGNISLNAGSTEQAQSIDSSARLRAGLEARIRASELNNSGGIDGQRLDVAVARLSNSGDIWQSGGQALQVQAQTLRNASGAAIGAVQVAAPAPVPSSAPPPAPESTTASASVASPSPAPAPAPSPAPAPLPAGLISVGGELINQGPATLAAAGELQVNTTQALLNAGHIRAASVHAQGDTLAVSAGTLQTDALAVDTQAVSLSGGAVVVGRATLDTTTYTQAQGAQLYSQGDLAIRARDLSNAGEIQSGTRATVDVAQTLIHTGTMAAAGDLMVTAGSVNSSGALAAGLNADGSLQAFAENGAQLNITATGDLIATGQNLASGALTLAGEAVNLSHSQTSAHTANITARGALNTDNAKIITSGDTGIKAQSMSNTAGTVYAGATVAVEVAQALASTGVIAAAGDLTVTAGRVNSSGTLAAGLNADGSLKAFAENGAQLRVNAFGDLSATGQNLASGNLALDGEAVGLNQSQTSAHTANIAARGVLKTDNAKLITSGGTHIEAQSLSNTAGTLYAGGSMAVNVAQAFASTGAIAAAGDLVVTAGSVSSSGTLAAGLNADGSLKAFAESGAQLRVSTTGDLSATGQNLASGALALNGEAVSLNQSQTSAHRADITARAGLDSRSAQVVTQQSLAVDAAGDVDNRQGRLVSLAGDIDITAQGVDNTQGLVVAATALSVNAGGAGITNTQGQLLAQDDLNLVTSGAVTNTEGLIQANAGVSVSATTLNNSQTTTDTQGIVGQDITLDVSTLDNTQGQVLAGRDLTVVAGTRINNTQGKLNAQRALTLQHSAPGTTTAQPATFQRVAGEPTTRTLAITNTGGQIVANNRDTSAGSSVTVQATTLGLDGTLSSGGDMALDLVGDLITTSGQTVRAGGQLSVQLNGGTFDNAGQWQAGTDLSVRADHIRNQVSGELLSQGTTTLDTTQNASGTVLNRGLVDGADTIIRTHTLDNAGGRVFGDRVALAADTVINREGPVAGSLVPRGGTIAARERLDMGVQQLTNKEDALIFSAGDLAIGGTLDANRRATADGSANAQTINNNSATIESLGNMALAAGTLRNTNEHLSWTLVPQGQTQATDYFTSQGIVSSRDVGWQSDKFRQPIGGSLYYFRPMTRGIVPIASQYGDAKYKAYYEGPQPFVEAHDETVGSVKNRSTYYVPDAFNYGRYAPIWAAFGLAPPAWDAPGPRPLPCAEGCWPDTYAQDMAVWQERAAPWEELNRRHAAMVQTVWQQLLKYDVYRTYTETVQTPVVKQTKPGTISAGGDLSLHLTGTGLNRDSVIVAGGTLSARSGQDANISNESTQVAAPTVRAGTTYDWGAVGRDCDLTGCDVVYGWRTNPYNETAWRQVALPALRYEQRASTASPNLNIQAKAPTGAIGATSAGHLGATAGALSGLLALTSAPSAGQANTRAERVIRDVARVGSAAIGAPITDATVGLGEQAPPGPVLPGGSLFTIHPESNARFVVETDPRFTNYRQWLSSDYLLSALAIDPATTQKRLGDGFYEQKLVREQVAALTGYRFLGDHRSDEAQYMALMNAGATFAQAQQLRPGIALSPAQVAQLTSDIVWLVAQTVTLPDGRTTTALVPQVYLAPRAGDLGENGQLFGGGAVISGNQVRLAMSGDVNNSGTIMGRQLVDISARNITNSGLIQGDVALLDAQQDIDVTGGRVAAVTGMVVNAERNLNITSTLARGQGAAANGVFASQQLDRVAGLYVSGEAGVLLASAGRDISLTAAQVHNSGRGITQLSAGGTVNLGTVQTGMSSNVTHDARNYARVQTSNEVGSSVSGGGAVTITATQDVNLRAANVNAQGALSVEAGGDISVQAGQDSYGIATASHRKASGMLGSTTVTQRKNNQFTTAQASELGGQTVALTSGGDTRITGSNVLADQNLSVRAGGNLTIDAAQNTQSQSSFNETKKSGVFGSGGVGVTIGKQQQSTDQQSSATSAAASTVGSIGGSVNLSAGQTYTQRGSDVLAPGGDVSISAQTVNIEEARETSASSVEQKFKQSGLTAAITSPVLSAVQTASQQIEAAGNTRSSRMQAMAAANAAANVLQAADAIAAGQAKEGGNLADQLGGIGLSVSLGASKSHSEQRMQSDSARGSSVAAGGDVTIRASGAGSSSDLTVRGSTIQAGGTARLSAEDEVNLLAAANTQSESSRSRSSGASIGANVNLGAAGAKAGVTVSANAGKGQGGGSGTSYTNTRIEAQQVSLESGGDTTLKGAVVQGEQVIASVGGDLTLQSLQDSSRYRESSQQVGASATFGPAPGGSLSAGQTKIRSDYQSVGEQSAIRAGDGGFQVSVEGQSALIGAQITSSEQAVQQGRNRYEAQAGTTTTDLQNTASYSAQSASVGVSAGASKPGASMSAGLSGAGVGSDSGKASSTSTAGISGIAGDSAARTGDAQTGLKPIFDKDEVKAEVQAQVAITAEFGKQATVVGARYADEQAVALRRDGHEDEARRWDEGGEYRVAMHAGIGALTGGRAGALGAGVGAALIPQVGEAIAELNMPEPVREALTMLAGAALGAAAGSTEGAAASFNQTANNYVTHSPYASVRRLVSQENARLTLACGNRCTAEDFRRIDQQVAALERAGNLAEIARHSGLSPAQGVQLAQLVTELLPGYGNAESLAQLVTGRSSLTGEEASRFWAAMGVLPLAGGVIKRVGEPSVEALTAIFRGGVATKPLATAADKALVPSAVQGQQLRGELAQWALPAVDHSRDAEYLAKTDKAVLSQNNFDMPHVLNGEVNAAGRATGYHAEFAADGAARIKPGATVTHNPNGTYEAPVQVFDAAKGEWVDKKNISTFFPPSWSQARIEYEISEAFKKGAPGTSFDELSPSGIRIQFHWDAKNQRTTFHPMKGDRK